MKKIFLSLLICLSFSSCKEIPTYEESLRDPKYSKTIIVYFQNGEILKQYKSLGLVSVSSRGGTCEFINESTGKIVKISGSFIVE